MGGGVVAKEDGEKYFRGLMGERAVEKMKERESGGGMMVRRMMEKVREKER